MQQLIKKYKRLLRLTESKFHRYMFDKVNWNGRLVGIVGARGVGKTTMILQHIKETMDVNRCPKRWLMVPKMSLKNLIGVTYAL